MFGSYGHGNPEKRYGLVATLRKHLQTKHRWKGLVQSRPPLEKWIHQLPFGRETYESMEFILVSGTFNCCTN
jgi:hypothetical protein